jgi:hypothetical protein
LNPRLKGRNRFCLPFRVLGCCNACHEETEVHPLP